MSVDIAVKKYFGDFTLDIQFQSQDNRIAVLGESGSGKSMLLKCIAGVMTPDEGHIIINDVTFFDSGKNIHLRPRQRRVGYLFQNYALFPNMTVEKNIGIGLREKKETKKKIVASLIEEYHLEGLEKRRPAELSGGQQQRTALARMMACMPEIILMDEPYSAMDESLKREMQREMSVFLKRYKGNLIFVSHSREEAYRFGREIAVIHDGKVLRMDGRDAIFEQPGSLQAARLVGFDNIEKGRKTDDFEVLVPAWGMRLKTETPVPEQDVYVAIRSRDIRRGSAGEENAFLAELTADWERPFYGQYLLKTAPEAKALCWVSEKNGETGEKAWICLPKNKLLLLGK